MSSPRIRFCGQGIKAGEFPFLWFFRKSFQKLRIALDCRNPVEMEVLQLRLQGRGYQIIPLNDLHSALGLLYLDPPDLVIVNLSTGLLEPQNFIQDLKKESYFAPVPVDQAEKICQTILDHFNMIVSDLFSEEEKLKKFYMAENRKGEVEKIPLLGIAIAVIPLTHPMMTHYGKVAESAASLKKFAKQTEGSRYVIERRTS